MTLLVVSCDDATLPPSPIGDMCAINIQNNQAVCLPINKQTFANVPYPRLGDYSYVMPVNDMNDYLAVSPETWINIQIYINTLKMQLKQTTTNISSY